MKKLIIAIIAMATVAIAASKPVCKETAEYGFEVIYTCMRPANYVKKIDIGVEKFGQSYSVTKIMMDGSKISTYVSLNKISNATFVTEYTYDDLDVLLRTDNIKLKKDQFFVLYNQLRDKYDLRRKK